MPITEKQLANRHKHLGSSDIPAILGVSPWANRTDIWLEKSGLLIKDTSTKPHLEAGNFLEGGVLDWAALQLGPLTRNQYRSRPELHLGCHIDAVVNESGEPVEGKTLQMFGDRRLEFGTAGTDQLPDDVLAQCTAHMIVLSRGGTHPEVTHVPVLVPGPAFVMYAVEWDEELVDIIKGECVKFWAEVESGTPPPDIPHMATLKLRQRECGKSCEIVPELLATWIKRKEFAKLANDGFKRAEREIISALGDCERGEAGELGAFLYRTEKAGDTIDRAAMKADGVYGRYASSNTRQVPRFVKPKKVKP